MAAPQLHGGGHPPARFAPFHPAEAAFPELLFGTGVGHLLRHPGIGPHEGDEPIDDIALRGGQLRRCLLQPSGWSIHVAGDW